MMSSMIRTLFLALYATTLLAFLDDLSPSTCVLALPLRTPFPSRIPLTASTYHPNPVHGSRTSKKTKQKQDSFRAFSRSARSRVVISRTLSAGHIPTNQEDADPFPQLDKYHQQAEKSSKNIHELAAESATIRKNDPLFQQESTAQITSFNDNLLGLEELLQQLAAAKGLAFYDRTNKLEGLLKDTVNLAKGTLKDIDIIVSEVPVLGPLLEPIVFNIKCVTDLLLDIIENLLDALLNPLQPLLRPLIGRALPTL